MGLIHVKPRRWSLEEYARMSEQGVFPPGERTELLEGEIISKPRMQNPPHVTGIILGNRVLMKRLGDTHDVAVQVTLCLSAWSAPEPDFVLVTSADWRPGQRLTTGDLVVEVADTSLAMDRAEKASLYALAGIAEYWIVNLVNRQVEVHRDPGPSSSAPYQAAYRTVTIHGEGTAVSPLCRSEVSIPVSDLLPPQDIPEQPASIEG